MLIASGVVDELTCGGRAYRRQCHMPGPRVSGAGSSSSVQRTHHPHQPPEFLYLFEVVAFKGRHLFLQKHETYRRTTSSRAKQKSRLLFCSASSLQNTPRTWEVGNQLLHRLGDIAGCYMYAGVLVRVFVELVRCCIFPLISLLSLHWHAPLRVAMGRQLCDSR